MRIPTTLFIILFFALNIFAQDWRKMTDEELKKAVPEKAPVVKENIETELRTASGVTDGKKQIFGVVIITAGYEAEGKYTHFLRVQKKIRAGEITLAPNDYVFGYQRLDADNLRVMFYQAKDGMLVGAVKAKVERKSGAIRSFFIEPLAANQGKIYIGRFVFEYTME